MIINMVNKLVDEKMEENADMAKKNRFPHVDISIGDKVKEEILDMSSQTQSQVAVGFQEMTNNDDADMIQQEMELVKDIESESDKIWDIGSKDGEIKMPPFGSLSSLNGQVKEEIDFNGEDETEVEKKKKDDAKLKRELRKRNLMLVNEDKKSGFTFNEVTRVGKGNDMYKYQTLASAATLGRLWDEGICEYQGNIQRGYKLNSKNEEVAVFSASHVKKILESALTQKLNGGVITLNILDTIPINYDEDDRTIQILPNQKLQILDGQHRIRCFSAWNRLYLKSPSSCISPEEFFMPILIEHVSEFQAKMIFSEYATKFLKISNSRSLFLDVDSNINRIATKVMNNSLKSKVEVVSNTISKKSDKIITFSVLTKGISAFKPATQKECEKVGNFLCLFWEELIENFPKSMGDVHPEIRVSEKTKSFANESMFMIGYHHIAKMLIDDEDWKIKLKKLTMDGFMNRTNPIWKDILRNENRIVNTSSTQTTVINNMLNQVIN